MLIPPTSTLALLALALAAGAAFAGSLQAPPGLFADVNDSTVGDAVIIDGTQLFIDQHLIAELKGARRVLNRPTKHTANPLFVPDRPWEEGVFYANGTVIHDDDEGLFKMWHHVWVPDPDRKGSHIGRCDYATSTDGIRWEKPAINPDGNTNIVSVPPHKAFSGQGVFKDPNATDPRRQYKMLYNDQPDGTAATLSTGAAYSPDGIHWTAEPANPTIPFSDTQACPYWDDRIGRYVAYLRFGPPNTRAISRIESPDFVHWSPKITTFHQRSAKLDRPFQTKLYGMRVMPYGNVYIGLLTAYHGETIQPIPDDKLWMDKSDVQLAYSRNGVTWLRVGGEGAIPHAALQDDRDWAAEFERATFIPYGEHKVDWDWGQIYPYQAPLVVGDEIRFYYTGIGSRHWASYHGDPEPLPSGVGLATLRLDGFVSVEGTGTLTTRALVFLGDTLEVNADAGGGAIRVEALDADGNAIGGFATDACAPLTSDSLRHVLTWNGSDDCHLIQGRPIRLRFHLENARLFSFTPRIRHNHYVPSYD